MSINQLKAYLSVKSKNKANENKPVILSTFNDGNDLREDINNDEEDFMSVVMKAIKPVEADLITCPWATESLILKHSNAFKSVKVCPFGAKTYNKEDYSSIELGAFRKYYGLNENDKVIATIGDYNFAKGLGELEAVARIMPEYEFFFFGGKRGILSNSSHYDKTNKIPNLHYEDYIPNEIYHSAIFSFTAAFFPYKYMTESNFALELMKAGVPIISNKNPFLSEMLVDKKTALIGDSVETFYSLLKNVGKENYAASAKEFASEFTVERYGERLKELYTNLILQG